MRVINAEKIRDLIADACIKANTVLPSDVLAALKKAYALEKTALSRKLVEAIIENAGVAKKKGLAICQDTGLPALFVEIGQDVKINGNLEQALQKGVEQGYRKGYFRDSIVKDPLSRGRSGFTPAVIHYEIKPGDKLKIVVLPKGFGCENKSALKMFNPTADIKQIKDFVVEIVKKAGPDACPPYVIGVGIGGTAEFACLLAKKALLNKVTGHRSLVTKLEEKILNEINKLNIGVMGLGGKTTAIGVNILTYPTHIAGLPVAVSISCHALRRASIII